MKTAIDYKFVEVRFQGKQVNDLSNFKLELKGNNIVLYYESKNNTGTYMRHKNLYPWKDKRGHYLSDRTDNFSLPGGKEEIFNIKDGKLFLKEAK